MGSRHLPPVSPTLKSRQTERKNQPESTCVHSTVLAQSSEFIRAYNSKPTKLALQAVPSEQPVL